MTEPPSRLELLQFARRVLLQQTRASLAQLDRWIADEEHRNAERRRGEERRPPPPEWLLQRGIGTGRPAACVHRGDCWAAKGVRVQAITEEQARRALHEDVAACAHCNPDTALGVLE
ncbi:DUF6233 domain-containing protein [Streptomyces phaeochromogenes]|uniref:DUF6233 domain-containing protein n=1 Tax=Streptomyces phaeochromogenes TaxID=1923 RepID=UPI0034073726